MSINVWKVKENHRCDCEKSSTNWLKASIFFSFFSFKEPVLSSKVSLKNQFWWKSHSHYFGFSLPWSQCLNQQLRRSHTAENDNHIFLILVSNVGEPQGCVFGPMTLFTLSAAIVGTILDN